MLEVAAAAQELEMAGPALRLLLDRRSAQVTENGTLLPDVFETLVENAAAVKLPDARH
jgi:hypothetical protein